jgi:hypothetical protein
MASTITALQTLVKWESRDSQFSLVDTNGIAIGNAIYRRLAALIDWPEFNIQDTSLSTTAGTEKYTWPAVQFLDVVSIEIQDPADNTKYKQISPAPSEFEFNLQRIRQNAFPELYKRGNDGTNNVIYFSPAPNIGSLTIKITGQTEPTAYTVGADTTAFINSSADDALTYLIAADILDKREQPQRANRLIGRAAEVLSRLAGKEITPDELKSKVLEGG